MSETLGTKLRGKPWVWLVAGALALAGAQVGFAAIRYALVAHRRLPPTLVRQTPALEAQQVDPSWILEGKPEFRTFQYAASVNGKTTSGTWECVGPTKFEWRFGADETVYILEGLVHIEHQGKKLTLGPGDTAFFLAGSRAVWHVPERVRKTYTLDDPGGLNRALRAVL